MDPHVLRGTVCTTAIVTPGVVGESVQKGLRFRGVVSSLTSNARCYLLEDNDESGDEHTNCNDKAESQHDKDWLFCCGFLLLQLIPKI